VWHEWIEIIFKVDPDRGRGDWSGPSWLRPSQSLWLFQPVLAGSGAVRSSVCLLQKELPAEPGEHENAGEQ
jgi:hypothetical protein